MALKNRAIICVKWESRGGQLDSIWNHLEGKLLGYVCREVF